MASHRIGPFGVEYDHLFMGDANNSFSVVNPVSAAFVNNRISQDVDYGHRALELPLRRLRGANRAILTRYLDLSSKLAGRNAGLFVDNCTRVSGKPALT